MMATFRSLSMTGSLWSERDLDLATKHPRVGVVLVGKGARIADKLHVRMKLHPRRRLNPVAEFNDILAQREFRIRDPRCNLRGILLIDCPAVDPVAHVANRYEVVRPGCEGALYDHRSHKIRGEWCRAPVGQRSVEHHDQPPISPLLEAPDHL